MEQEKRESVIPPDWVAHEHTRKTVRYFQEALAQAKLDLMRSATTSNDANVRGDAVRVEQTERFLAHLTGRVGTDGGMQ
jgi:hypothetical protein